VKHLCDRCTCTEPTWCTYGEPSSSFVHLRYRPSFWGAPKPHNYDRHILRATGDVATMHFVRRISDFWRGHGGFAVESELRHEICTSPHLDCEKLMLMNVSSSSCQVAILILRKSQWAAHSP
jgi:hypothetical protein